MGGELEGVGGIPLNELEAVIMAGIGKINIDTDMRLSITRDVREYLASSSLRNSDPILKSLWENFENQPSEIDFRIPLKPLENL